MGKVMHKFDVGHDNPLFLVIEMGGVYKVTCTVHVQMRGGTLTYKMLT